MNDSKFKLADTITNQGSAVINQGENFEGNQYNATQNTEKKLDTILSNLNETQKQDMKELANEIENFFDARLDKLSEEQREKYESAKSSGWKGKVKLFVPFIKHFGVDLEVEREFNPQEVASKVLSGARKILYGDEMTALNLLNS